ncbi:hypothetical protein CVIRNUC_000069 [Coccomyxa viridis]|uniref:DNA/RNA-binding protein Alba-like domain-containing protein n=1 Tax=Coccomyxa viridis TaxID=1274662 RepID=A0AAV1HTS2_9CHLO|nr:hypothetical protein CVIRNUC_000069 [Coccomyxa viridis]
MDRGQTTDQPGHPARVQVSSSGKPLHYFVELSKRFLQEHGEVQLSAIGLAIPQAVNVSQILTTSGFATELRIRTGLLVSDEGSLDGTSGTLPKGKIEIVLRKSDDFESLVAGGMPAQRTQRESRQGALQVEEAVTSA